MKIPPSLNPGRHGISAFVSVALVGTSLANWDAAPIDVHEWGVNTYDWDTGQPLVQDLPEYLYTDLKPGESFPSPNPRVRDLPADSGIRTKPLLYFYPSERIGRGPTQAQVGVEMRFADGYANAWWPQVNHYRNEDDKRMQLAWEKLTLHPKIPKGQTLPGEKLKDDHWAKIAREVDAAFVSNGKEAERYLFYEGKTGEEPAIALLPADGGARFERYWREREEEQKEISLINVGKHPIYDVIAIYRDAEKGLLWTAHLPVMPPQTVALRIPDFENPRKEDDLKLSPEIFRRRTTGHLIENLTSGTTVPPENVTMRNPAEPQGATQRHQLFRKEAIGLEKIWHNDFFEADGLTVIYRESPAYLDEAMPLHIFTSAYWHIRLSRCGIVLNRNLPIHEVYRTEEALWDYQIGEWNEHLKKQGEAALPQLKKNRLLTLGQARFHLPPNSEAAKTQLEKIRNLFK